MRYIISFLFLFCCLQGIAQNVGIGTNTPHASAALEVAANGKGLLIPRMIKTERLNITNPSKGLTVYQTDDIEGYWYYDGLDWLQLMQRPNGGIEGQVITICGGKLTWTTNGVCPALVSTLNCGGATSNGLLTANTAASGVNSIIPYTGGNAGFYTLQTISSTGVTGLTATLEADTLASGAGTLTFIITGTPNTSGTASFEINFGGQTCTLTRLVGITSHGCGATNVHNTSLTYGSMTDQDGNQYKTIKIGLQTWMAENLKTTKYRNGTSILNITDKTQWGTNTTTGAYCSYNNNTANDCPYGKLYNWYAVSNANNLCPVGWHIPTTAEWTTLTSVLGGESVAGGKMKSTGTQYWLVSNTDATNSSGFSGLPGGYRLGDIAVDFTSITGDGFWWSSTESSAFNALYRTLTRSSGSVGVNSIIKSYGFSVRCVKDENPTLTTLNCAGAIHTGTLIQGENAVSVISEISYSGGNGDVYAAQSISSTGVTGLTATLATGTLANGSGIVTYTITGTPSTSGTASFAISLAGQTCTLTRMVEVSPTLHSCGALYVHNAALTYGSMTDQDGNQYKTIKIGLQTWMAENLKTTKYRNGTSILNITDKTQWGTNTTTGAYCSYNNNTANDCPYGKLYNWYAVSNANNLCPVGWHIPTTAEWTTLTSVLGGESVAGGKMKSTGTQYWLVSNTDATNSSGFSGLPCGYRLGDPAVDFTSITGNGLWWSLSESSASNAWSRGLNDTSAGVGANSIIKSYGCSVRCVKD